MLAILIVGYFVNI